MAEKTWGQIGREVAGKLKNLESDEAIAKLGNDIISLIYARESEPKKRENALKMVSREILKLFPRERDETENYYFDESGKTTLPKWRHKIFQSLTLDRASTPEPASKPEAPTKKQTLDTMSIDQLNLDSETKQKVEAALNHSGMSLAEFTRRAMQVYANTLMGKLERQQEEDISTIPTDKLLNDPAYSTYPGKGEELTRRAIRAMKTHNDEIATESDQRWCITQSAIASLTGSKPATIGKAMKPFKQMIDEHNAKYELNGYSNRKGGDRDISKEINLTELAPTGLD